MTEQELKEIEQRAEKATKGPWRHTPDYENNIRDSGVFAGKRHIVHNGYDSFISFELNPDDNEFIAYARQDIPALVAEVRRLRERKDGAYLERNKCVVLIVRMALALGLRAGIAQHDPNDKDWDDDWRTVVYIDLPSGQISWHFHDTHVQLLGGLPFYAGAWDGHSTNLKYERVLAPGDIAQENARLQAEKNRLRPCRGCPTVECTCFSELEDELLKKFDVAHKENARLREALEFYADEKNWMPTITWHQSGRDSAQYSPYKEELAVVPGDNGKRARDALGPK